jgi:hypothetical protein
MPAARQLVAALTRADLQDNKAAPFSGGFRMYA